MSGETNLDKLLASMKPQLHPGEYVFVTSNEGSSIKHDDSIAFFKEEEGTTFIISKHKADQLGLAYDFIAAWITLKVHSSLSAVGLTAAFSSELARYDLSCNVVAGYFHDHIFVEADKKDQALEILKALSASKQ